MEHHSHDHENRFPEIYDHNHAPLSTKTIWKVFWILLAVTLFEVGISFAGIGKTILLTIFVILTIVKSFYIVGTFMHLKFEKKFMQWTLLLPFILIIYLIFISIYEGSAIATY